MSITSAYLKIKGSLESTIVQEKIEPSVETLTETTVPEDLAHIPASWRHHYKVDDRTKEKIESVLTHGSFTHFPLDQSMSDADPDVVEHLTRHGYAIKDYIKGIATRTAVVGAPEKGIPFREKTIEEKIGSALERTNASSEVKSAFMNDSARATGKMKDRLHVVISTTPHAIAGMTIGTNWADQSCMHLATGANKHFLQHDSENGTHAAYLVKPDDEQAFKFGEPSSPIARILIKPFHTEDGKDTIFRPENKTYGASSTAFSDAVHQWARSSYPAQKDVSYHKNKNLYNDDSTDVHYSLSKNLADESMAMSDPLGNLTRMRVIEPHMTDYIINKIKAHGEGHVEGSDAHRAAQSHQLQALANLTSIRNLTTHHVARMMDVADTLQHSQAVSLHNKIAQRHGSKLSSSRITELYPEHENLENVDVPKEILMAHKLPEHVIDRLHPSELEFVRLSKIKPHHLNNIIKHVEIEKGYGTSVSHFKDMFTKQQLNRLVGVVRHASSALSSPIRAIVSAKNFDQDVHSYAVKSAADSSHLPGANKFRSILLENSPYTKVEDALKSYGDGHSDSIFGSLIWHRDSLPEGEGPKLRNVFMGAIHNHIKTTDLVNDDMSDVEGIYRTTTSSFYKHLLPKHVSDHLKDEDYHTLAKGAFVSRFKDKAASQKYIDAQHALIQHLDSKPITDPDEKNSLIFHVDAHAKSLERHMEDHGRGPDDDLNEVTDLKLKRDVMEKATALGNLNNKHLTNSYAKSIINRLV
jgi:hypothetical protein